MMATTTLGKVYLAVAYPHGFSTWHRSPCKIFRFRTAAERDAWVASRIEGATLDSDPDLRLADGEGTGRPTPAATLRKYASQFA